MTVLEVYRPLGDKHKLLQRTETVDGNLNPTWRPLQAMPLSYVCDGDLQMKLKVSLGWLEV